MRIPGQAMCLSVVCGMLATPFSQAQQPFDLDTSFRVGFNDWYVSSILPLDDGTLLLSGQIRYPEVLTFTHRGSVKVDQNGGRIDDFPGFPYSTGGGKLTRWNEKIYVSVGQTVRRLLGDGLVDPTFIQMNDGPYFGSLQGGDYHVFPDGRVLMTGAHTINDPARGFNGLYNLIWFSNTGYLDTTRIHRRGSGVLGEIEELANGQFLCWGTVDEYDGQSCGWVFRINADGTLDPSLQTDVNWGRVNTFLPLADGRFYAGGIFRRNGLPSDTLRVVRFLANGALDPTFVPPTFSYSGQPDPGELGPRINEIYEMEHGRILVTGAFQKADDSFRRGICVLDSAGVLQDVFDECGVGLYYYEDYPYASVAGYVGSDDGMAYIWGAYHGYNDGTVNDTLQRFVSRLYGPDWPTAVQAEEVEESHITIFPNPASGQVTVRFPWQPGGQDGTLLIKDAMGRTMATQRIIPSQEHVELDIGHLAHGWYTVVVNRSGQVEQVEKLVVY